jgi:hypothetical protein
VESGLPNTHNCSLKQGDCGSERTIKFAKSDSGQMKMEYENSLANGAHLDDYLGIWILGIDFHPNAACIKLDAEEDCDFNVQ